MKNEENLEPKTIYINTERCVAIEIDEENKKLMMSDLDGVSKEIIQGSEGILMELSEEMIESVNNFYNINVNDYGVVVAEQNMHQMQS